MPTVQSLYNRPDFPSTDYGKEKKAEVHVLLNNLKYQEENKYGGRNQA
ncbi:MAG: hypothetical protein U0M66_01185 [Bacilli bacterium]|nr:hypothetical protein [Bacilli bacterium]